VVTTELDAQVRRLVDDGHTVSRACELAGVARKTWYRHLERQFNPQSKEQPR
jgi:hypothetical protein